MKLLLFLAFYSRLIWGQPMVLELEGTYKIASSTDTPISFSLSWKEDEEGRVKGIYRDNFYSKSALLTGFNTSVGRNFTVVLPTAVKGVKSISILSSKGELRDFSTTIPVSIVTRDARGTPLTTVSASGRFSSGNYLAQKQEDECGQGMGNLEGFCGLYSGMVSEDSDAHNKCDLTGSDALNLQLRDDGSISLLFGRASEILVQPRHEVGRIPSNPQSNSIDLLSRHCQRLERTNFPSDNCKRVHLSGSFLIERNTKHFKGSYTIVDEKTNQSCKYGLSMDVQE